MRAEILQPRSVARPLYDRVLELGLADRRDHATRVLMQDAVPANEAWLDAVQRNIELQHKASDEAFEASRQEYRDTRALLQADGARQVSTRGAELVAQVERTMLGIDQASERIAEIIATIDGIAFQTDILALNAALVEESAGAAESLRRQAERLLATVQVFRLAA